MAFSSLAAFFSLIAAKGTSDEGVLPQALEEEEGRGLTVSSAFEDEACMLTCDTPLVRAHPKFLKRLKSLKLVCSSSPVTETTEEQPPHPEVPSHPSPTSSTISAGPERLGRSTLESSAYPPERIASFYESRLLSQGRPRTTQRSARPASSARTTKQS